MNKNIVFISVAAIVLVLGIVLAPVWSPKVQESLGSVNISNEYHATTTQYNTALIKAGQGQLVKTGSGALGSVVILASAPSTLYFYDATTTNVLLRTDQKATSTIWLASFPASAAVGTYTFDSIFVDGLLIEGSSATNVPTTTITWR